MLQECFPHNIHAAYLIKPEKFWEKQKTSLGSAKYKFEVRQTVVTIITPYTHVWPKLPVPQEKPDTDGFDLSLFPIIFIYHNEQMGVSSDELFTSRARSLSVLPTACYSCQSIWQVNVKLHFLSSEHSVWGSDRDNHVCLCGFVCRRPWPLWNTCTKWFTHQSSPWTLRGPCLTIMKTG